ncbi:Crp/Fnr family transcriptional regulator [Chryseolinea soli]|uniref:Crp/Fnr family transcriptional regulator n=1 Tax=Chryseolinea soli TaxID=2321403 RepID=A0A385SJT6_9BACT|nr:Crp/Fnr family transcriptional regulator [Chryseolinea soli]AYB32013.1 Crp/Fnr family transcriptional regulator [Chryseolinea soli]
MDTERLFELLNRIYPVSEEFRNAIERELIQLSFPKNHVLLEPPNVAGHSYFINSGFAISYTYFEGKKDITWLWPAGGIMVAGKSLFEQVASREFIQLVEPSELLCMSYHSLLKLFEAYPETNILYRAVLHQYFEQSQARIEDMKNLSAIQNYRKLINGFPGIEQVLSQEQISSYLGIAPQSLSRMKKRNERS